MEIIDKTIQSNIIEPFYEKKNYCSIDLVKFLAAILVLAIHTRPFYEDSTIDYYFTSLCRVAVPFFFISTSFFFFLKENPDIRKYTKRLLFLYLAWFIIELPFVYHRFFVAYNNSLPLQLLNFVRSLVFNNTWYASWFIMACILSVNIIYWLSRKLGNVHLIVLGILFYLLALTCSSYSGAIDLALNEPMRYYHTAIADNFMPANSFMVAFIYVVLGKIVAERIQKKELNGKTVTQALLFVVIILFCMEIYLIRWSVSINDAFLALPLLTLLGFIVILHTKVSIRPQTSRWLREMSILIYILHPIFSQINPLLFGLNYGGGYVCNHVV